MSKIRRAAMLTTALCGVASCYTGNDPSPWSFGGGTEASSGGGQESEGGAGEDDSGAGSTTSGSEHGSGGVSAATTSGGDEGATEGPGTSGGPGTGNGEAGTSSSTTGGGPGPGIDTAADETGYYEEWDGELGPQGERYPFPQNVIYPYGQMSANITSDHVKQWYEAWRTKYLQDCNGNLRPGTDPISTSLVEAQGWATMAAAYMGDREVVDRLQAYYESKRTNQGCGLMGWKNNCAGFEDTGAATDGDIDVAAGLLVAHWQWPDGGYDEKARGVLSNLKRMILDCGGTSALYPGCQSGRPWGGCNETDISYYSPAFFRHFAELTDDAAWAKLADDSHKIRDAAANPSTGLVPDWQSTSGTAGAGSRKGYYSFDAIRTPFKHGLDYLWNGNEQARAWCEKISGWAYGQGVGSIVDGYQLNGSRAGSNHNLAVVGSLAVCSMANSQEVVDAFVAETVKLRDDYWYSGYLGTLYLLAVSGNMWTPEIVRRQ